MHTSTKQRTCWIVVILYFGVVFIFHFEERIFVVSQFAGLVENDDVACSGLTNQSHWNHCNRKWTCTAMEVLIRVPIVLQILEPWKQGRADQLFQVVTLWLFLSPSSICLPNLAIVFNRTGLAFSRWMLIGGYLSLAMRRGFRIFQNIF